MFLSEVNGCTENLFIMCAELAFGLQQKVRGFARAYRSNYLRHLSTRTKADVMSAFGLIRVEITLGYTTALP